MNRLTRPLPYEIRSGERVIQTMSITEADREYRRLLAEGRSAEIWLGEMRVRNGGGRLPFTSLGGTYRRRA